MLVRRKQSRLFGEVEGATRYRYVAAWYATAREHMAKIGQRCGNGAITEDT
jgi:hypothetical protein